MFINQVLRLPRYLDRQRDGVVTEDKRRCTAVQLGMRYSLDYDQASIKWMVPEKAGIVDSLKTHASDPGFLCRAFQKYRESSKALFSSTELNLGVLEALHLLFGRSR